MDETGQNAGHPCGIDWCKNICFALIVALQPACSGAAAGTQADASVDSGRDAGEEPDGSSGSSALPVVESVQALRPTGGGRLDWCADGRIAYDSVDKGVWNIRIMNESGGEDVCVTCDGVPGLPAGVIVAQPAWHPSCGWLVVQVGSTTLENGAIRPRYFGPGWGVHADLYLLAADGTAAYPLVTLTRRFSASLHPHFSSSGDQLFWTVREPLGSASDLADLDTVWRGWHLSVADVDMASMPPSLRNRRELFDEGDPASRGFFESHALDEGTLWYSRTDGGAAFVDEGFSASLDDLASARNWTESPGTWEEHLVTSPSGRLVSFNSSSGFGWHHPPDRFDSLSMELWVQDVQTGKRKTLTTYNDALPQADKDAGVHSVTSDYAWGPSGDRIAVYSVLHERGVIFQQRIDLLVLDDCY